MYLPPRKKKPEQLQPGIEETVYYEPENLPAQEEESTPELRPPEATRRRRDSAPRPRKSAAGRVVLVVLLLVPATFYVMEYLRCIEFTHSRDRLFDTYAQEVIRRQAPRLFFWTEVDEIPVMLPDDVLGGWEREFGDDPRYWQLRYCCTADVPEDIIAQYEGTGLRPELYYLEVAREEGKADAATLWVMWWEYHALWRDEYAKETGDADFSWTEVDQFELERAIHEKHGDEIFGLLDDMIAAEPALSYPYYLRARQHYIIGDIAAALVDLRSGNDAADNRLPVPFPLSAAIAAAHENLPVANQTLQSGLVKLASRRGLPNLVGWKQLIAEVSSADLPDKRGWLDACHWFSCRFGDMQNATSTQRMSAAYQIRKMSDEALAVDGAMISEQQRRELLKVGHYSSTIAHLVVEQMRCRPGMGKDVGLKEFQVIAGQIHWGYSGRLRVSEPWFSADFEDLKGNFNTRFHNLAQFDYITMSWPEEDAETVADQGS